MFRFDATLSTCIEADLKSNGIPMLLGEPGIGKSSWVEALAANMHTQCFTLPCNQLADKADLTGARLVPVEIDKRVPDGNGGFTIKKEKTYTQMFYPHEVIHTAIEYAQNNPREWPILFLDELNRTTPDVTSELLSIPTMRRIGSSALPSNLRVIIAGNDKGNVTSLDEASVSRFVLYDVQPDLPTFLAVNPDLNPFIKNVLQKDPSLLFTKPVTTGVTTTSDDDDDDNTVSLDTILDDMEDMAQFTTPRTITSLSRWLNQFDNKQLMQLLSTPLDTNNTNALQAAIEGHVGQTNFATFLLAEISNNILNTNNQASVQFAKPNCYDQMKACTDMMALDTFVGNMTPNERSACAAYALTEATDNTRYLQVLANHLTNFAADDARAVLDMLNKNMLDAGNIEALKQTRTGLGDFLNMFATQF